MPKSVPHLCSRCQRSFTTDRFCTGCTAKDKLAEQQRRHDDEQQRTIYHTHKWRKFRDTYISLHPWCVAVLNDGKACMRLANTPDHIKPIKAGGAIWDYNNLQPLCQSCHSRKTMTETRQRYR